jgi:hypothetical protein
VCGDVYFVAFIFILMVPGEKIPWPTISFKNVCVAYPVQTWWSVHSGCEFCHDSLTSVSDIEGLNTY